MRRYSVIPVVVLLSGFLVACGEDTSEPPRSVDVAPAKQAAKVTAAVPEPAQGIYEQGMAYARDNDNIRAAEFFQQAAEKGNRHAQYQLGLLFARGAGVKQDFKEARAWLHRAAMGGHPKAQYHLGEMYVRGDGVKEDHVEALAWFWLATTLGDRYSEKRLRAIAPRLTPEQMAEAKIRSDVLWKQIPHDLKIKRFSMH
ncbi:MAG: tetratricopeptide repeat protein [Mariprofundaceae bacterium]